MYHPIKKQNMLDLAEYQKKLWETPHLQYLFFELTDRCNLHCRHCGSSCSGKNETCLPYPVILKTLKEVAEAYDPETILVCLTGGEPMLYPFLFKVIRAAHDMGYPVGMTSNGTLIDANVSRRLLLSGLDTISVSIDGIGRTHDEFRCSVGSFEKAMTGIRVLNQDGMSVLRNTAWQR